MHGLRFLLGRDGRQLWGALQALLLVLYPLEGLARCLLRVEAFKALVENAMAAGQGILRQYPLVVL